MSKLGCSCGHVIVDQTDFLPFKARLTADEDWDRVPEEDIAYPYHRTMYECEVCGRLLVEVEQNHYISFLPEQERRGILTSPVKHPTRPEPSSGT